MANTEQPIDIMARDMATDAFDVAWDKFKDACSMATKVRRMNKRNTSSYKLSHLAQDLSESFKAAADAAREAEKSQIVAQYGPTRFLES